MLWRGGESRPHVMVKRSTINDQLDLLEAGLVADGAGPTCGAPTIARACAEQPIAPSTAPDRCDDSTETQAGDDSREHVASSVPASRDTKTPKQNRNSRRTGKRALGRRPDPIRGKSRKRFHEPKPAKAAEENARDPAPAEVHFLSVREVARRYSTSIASIWRWVAQGIFPRPYKVAPGSTRWSVADLYAYDRSLEHA